MSKAADFIKETDDDNIPMATFWNLPSSPNLSIISEKNIWYNAYSHFSDFGAKIWPRGFPLEKINLQSLLIPSADAKLKTLIYQGLANGNPDVDAVFRFTRNLPVNFIENEAIQLGKNVWCPFNSQNTLFLPKAFPLLYLPSTCTFRMTDIWRSFIAQRCLWEMNAGIAFHSATVFQERNEHSLLKDFEDEIPGYLGNEKIVTLLSNCNLKKDDIYVNLTICYATLVQNGYFEKRELDILSQWISSCKKFIRN